MRVKLPSPAMIVALLALAVALGGTTYAAVKLKKNSVKTKNIKPKAVTEPKLGDKAVSTRTIGDKQVKHGKLGEEAVEADKIKNGTITPNKLADPSLTIQGWAQVRGSDGMVLDGRNLTVTRLDMGSYCIDANFAVHGAWVSQNLTTVGATTDHDGLFIPGTGCGAPHTDLRVDFINAALNDVDRDFFVFAN